MAGDRWIFTTAQLQNTPSRKAGIDAEKELTYRQQGGQLIQDMGQRLHVTQLCINTAIVYLHRFYMFHSFTKFHRNCKFIMNADRLMKAYHNAFVTIALIGWMLLVDYWMPYGEITAKDMAPACLFLAAKVEEQPRKLEHVVSIAHRCLNRDEPALDTKSEKYLEKAQELVVNENILLQTLGFEITVDHPHTHVIKTCQLVRSSKDLTQTSYFLATNSLHLTTMCLQYKPTVVCCVAIHLACKWSSWEFPQSSEGRQWWWYVDKTVTEELLEQLVQEFLNIIDKCPTKLKQKILTYKGDKDLKGDLTDSTPGQPGSTRHPTKRAEPSAAIGKQQADGKLMKPPAPSSVLTAAQQQQQQQQQQAAGMRRCKSDAHLPSMALSYKEYKERKEMLKQGQSDKKVPTPIAEQHTSSRINSDNRQQRQLGSINEARAHGQTEFGRSHHGNDSSSRLADARLSHQHGDNRKRDAVRTHQQNDAAKRSHLVPNDNQSTHKPIPSDSSRAQHGTPNADERTAVKTKPLQNDLSASKSKIMSPEDKAAIAAQRHEHYKDRHNRNNAASGGGSESVVVDGRRDRHRDRHRVDKQPDAAQKSSSDRHRDSVVVKPEIKLEQQQNASSSRNDSAIKADGGGIPKLSIRKSPLEPDWIKEQRPDYRSEHSTLVTTTTTSQPLPPSHQPPLPPPPPSQPTTKLTLRIPPPKEDLEPGEIVSTSPTTPSKVPVVKLERLTESQISAHHRPAMKDEHSHKHSRSKSDSHHRKDDRHKSSSSSSGTPRIEPLRLKVGSGGEVKKSEQKIEKLRIKLVPGGSAAERHFTDMIKDDSKQKERDRNKHHEHHKSTEGATNATIEKPDDLRIAYKPTGSSSELKLTISKSRLQSPSGGGDEKRKSKHHSSSRKRHHSPGKSSEPYNAKLSRRDNNSAAAAGALFSPPQPQMNILQAVAESLGTEANGDKRTASPGDSDAITIQRHKHKKSKHHSPVAAVKSSRSPSRMN